MTLKTRRFIFYVFLILFIILASTVILYAQGYGFDWQAKSLFKGGAFYFKSYPKEADVYINNKYWGKTNELIKRLPPKEYDIKISKLDYYDWQKTLGIKSKLVTEAKNILLIKKNPSLSLVTKNNVKYFSFSPNKKKVIYLTDKATREINPEEQKVADPREIPTYSTPALRLIELTNNTDTQIYPAPLTKGAKPAPSIPKLNDLTNILWSNDNEKLILSFSDNSYYILNSKNQLEIISLNNLIKILSNYKIYNIEKPFFHPQNFNKIYFLANNNLYLVDLAGDLSLPVVINILTYNIHNNEILYISSLGEFYKTNLGGSSFKKILDIPFFKPEQNIIIVNEKVLIIDNELYLFNPQAQVFEKNAENTIEVSLSSDDKKLLWRTKNEIGVIWLYDDFEQPLRKKYETEIVMKTFEEIDHAMWYSKTNQHIIFIIKNEIKITELDGRDKRNTANVFSIENQKTFYNEENDKLYILNKEQFFEIKMNI